MAKLLNLHGLSQELLGLLKLKGQTLSLAESCSGGMISHSLTSISGASAVFNGSVVSYANQVKQEVLGVNAQSLHQVGAVSEVVAKEMAEGVKELLKSTWSLSVTGIAGPTGGSKEKPVGTVCFAVCGPGFVSSETQHFSGSRQEIQAQSTEHALKKLIEVLKQ